MLVARALKNSQLTRQWPGERHAYFGDRTLAPSYRPVLASVRDQFLKNDIHQKQRPDHNLGPPTVKRPIKNNDLLDQPKDEVAHERAGYEANSTGQERASNHHRRNCV